MLTYALCALIFITGAVSIQTDIAHRQIKNQHLIIIGLSALLVHAISIITRHPFPLTHFLGLGIAIAIGIVLYYMDLWRPGDAKLFILYSLLMPPTNYQSTLPLPCLVLFINTFIAGLIFLVPALMRYTASHKKIIYLRIIAAHTRRKIIHLALLSLAASWLLFPLYARFKTINSGFISFIIFYIIIGTLYQTLDRILRNKIILALIIATGTGLRLLLTPDFFTWKSLLQYLGTNLLYTTLYVLIYNCAKHISTSKERVPFAPFLFLGCLLSYTPFLAWIISVIRR